MKFLFKSFLLFAISGISLLIVLNISHVTAISNGASTCPDYEIIFARGSGQEIHDTDYRNFKKAIDQKLANTNIKYSFYELGERKTSGSYPAVSVAKFKTALGIYLDVGDSYKFKNSVEQGAIELLSRIAYYNKTCPSKKYILAGYSQGAMVITKSLTSINSSRIIYIANFGDPKLYLPEGKGLFPQACRNKNLSKYRVYAPYCRTYQGILSAEKPYSPAGYQNKIGAWCNGKDIMCGAKLNLFDPLKDHLSYNQEKGYSKAAKIIYNKIRQNEKLKQNYRYPPSSSYGDPFPIKMVYPTETGPLDIITPEEYFDYEWIKDGIYYCSKKSKIGERICFKDLSVATKTVYEIVRRNKRKNIQYQKMDLPKNDKQDQYIVKKLQLNHHSKHSILAVNGVVYGITTQKEINLLGLKKNRGYSINISEYNENGEKIKDRVIQKGNPRIKVPAAGMPF